MAATSTKLAWWSFLNFFVVAGPLSLYTGLQCTRFFWWLIVDSELDSTIVLWIVVKGAITASFTLWIHVVWYEMIRGLFFCVDVRLLDIYNGE